MPLSPRHDVYRSPLAMSRLPPVRVGTTQRMAQRPQLRGFHACPAFSFSILRLLAAAVALDDYWNGGLLRVDLCSDQDHQLSVALVATDVPFQHRSITEDPSSAYHG